MDTYRYCKTLDNVTKAELINAVHQLTLQLAANGLRAYSERLGTDLDNAPAINAGASVLAKAGHPGYSAPDRVLTPVRA